MNRFVVSLALFIALAACSHTTKQGKDYTVTHSEEVSIGFSFFGDVSPEDFQTMIFHVAYVHSEHSSDWGIYARATSELCSPKPEPDCGVIWFDGLSPQTPEEVKQWNEGDQHQFVEVANLDIGESGEVEGSIDCERIDAPHAQKTLGNPFEYTSPVQCKSVVKERIRYLKEVFPKAPGKPKDESTHEN